MRLRTAASVTRSTRWFAAACASLALLALAGCGLGAGATPSAIKLTVTEDFGAHVVRSFSAPRVNGQETVMSLLTRNAKVATRFGGGFVESIDGLSGGGEGSGRPVDWFYFVNGVEAARGAAGTDVHPGDAIWWDRHDWSQTDSVPAVVGSFPQPFVSGIEGKRLPVRVECAQVAGSACETVAARLRAAGVLAGIAALGPGDEPQTLRVLVGPWPVVSASQAGAQLEQGPRVSGVYARFSGDGGTLTLLDAQGAPARALGSGAGLVAATRSGEDAPVWLVTGTDAAGVTLAAQAFDKRALGNRFAVAVAPGGQALPAPAPG